MIKENLKTFELLTRVQVTFNFILLLLILYGKKDKLRQCCAVFLNLISTSKVEEKKIKGNVRGLG